MRPEAVRRLAALLGDIVKADITRTSPYSGDSTGEPFNGSYDWHSSVHAHWMLLSVARVTGNEYLENWVSSRLTPSVLQGLVESFTQRPQFENPYGQAWLLLLLAELERRPGQDPALIASLRERLLTNLDGTSDPRNPYADPDFVLFALEQGNVGDHPLRSSLRAEAQARRPRQASSYDFLVPAFMRSVALGERPHSLPEVQVPASLNLANCHVLGQAASTTWLNLVRETGPRRRELCQAVSARINGVLSHPFLADLSDEEYFVYFSHWVPQFLWMAIHLNH
jgi:hypothetical protein